MSWIISWSSCTKRWQMSTKKERKENLNFSSSSFSCFIQITFSESPLSPYRTFRGKFRKYQNSSHSSSTDESILCVHILKIPSNCTTSVSSSHSKRSKSDRMVCDFDLYRCQHHLRNEKLTFICSNWLHRKFWCFTARRSNALQINLKCWWLLWCCFLSIRWIAPYSIVSKLQKSFGNGSWAETNCNKMKPKHKPKNSIIQLNLFVRR